MKIPVGHHVKLHSMKVLTGKQISDAVTEALDAYFATARADTHATQADVAGFDDVRTP